MNSKIISFGVLLFLLGMPCVGQTTYVKPLNKQISYSEESLLHHIKTLSSDAFEGRRTGTKGGIKAKQYIINQFEKLNVLPLGESFEQAFFFNTRGKTYNADNVLGLIKGTEFPDTYIVISAHYDHVGILKGDIYNGADDDASGVSALFSFAEHFKNSPPMHSVILAAFDGEELGLKGSQHYVKHSIIPFRSIMMNINMDMISRSDKHELFAVGTRFNETLKRLILNSNTSKKINLLTGHDGDDGKENWTYSSDHGSFHKRGIPFLYFGVADHKDYHKPTDDYENIQPVFYKEAVRLIISVFNKVDAVQLKE
jgi:Peptidase family M28